MRILTCFCLLQLLLFSASAQPNPEQLAISEARYFPLETKIYYQLGEKEIIPIRLIRYGNDQRYFCFNMHDNEFTAVQAARSVLETKGGVLLKIDNRGQRLIRFRLKGKAYAVDPNRVFSRTGIEQSLRENGPVDPGAIEAVERFGQRLLALIPDSISTVIALHNNTEGAYSVKSYLPGGERAKDALDVKAIPGQDEDDIVFTTDPGIFRAMANAGYNSILQDNEKVKQDGSLSVYFGNLKRSYVNIETQHGRKQQYAEMLEKLLDYLSEPRPQGSDSNDAVSN